MGPRLALAARALRDPSSDGQPGRLVQIERGERLAQHLLVAQRVGRPRELPEPLGHGAEPPPAVDASRRLEQRPEPAKRDPEVMHRLRVRLRALALLARGDDAPRIGADALDVGEQHRAQEISRGEPRAAAVAGATRGRRAPRAASQTRERHRHQRAPPELRLERPARREPGDLDDVVVAAPRARLAVVHRLRDRARRGPQRAALELPGDPAGEDLRRRREGAVHIDDQRHEGHPLATEGRALRRTSSPSSSPPAVATRPATARPLRPSGCVLPISTTWPFSATSTSATPRSRASSACRVRWCSAPCTGRKPRGWVRSISARLLRPVRVPARVDAPIRRPRHELDAEAEQPGHHVDDRAIVARDDAAREHDPIPLFEAQERCVPEANRVSVEACSACVPLAMTRSARAASTRRPRADEQVARPREPPHGLRGPHVRLHAAAEQADLAARADRGLTEGEEALDVRGEDADHDARRRGLDELRQRVGDGALAPASPGESTLVLSTGSSRTPASPSARKRASSVGSPSSGVGSSLKSPVWTTSPAAVSDRERRRVDDRVRHPERLHDEAADRDLAPDLRGQQAHLVLERVLREPVAHQLQRVGRAPDGDVEVTQEERQPADVVLVAVRQHDAAHLIAEREHVIEARVVDVDAEVRARERHPAVDEQQPIRLLEREAVHPDLAEPSEGHEPQGGRRWQGSWIGAGALCSGCTFGGGVCHPGRRGPTARGLLSWSEREDDFFKT